MINFKICCASLVKLKHRGKTYTKFESRPITLRQDALGPVEEVRDLIVLLVVRGETLAS